MKTQSKLISKGYFKTLLLSFIILTGSGLNNFASAGKIFNIRFDSGTKINDEEKLSKELLTHFAEEDETTEKLTYQILDENDDLIFEGPESDWGDNRQEKLQILKRKAEFLFRTGNEKVFKIFSPKDSFEYNSRNGFAFDCDQAFIREDHSDL